MSSSNVDKAATIAPPVEMYVRATVVATEQFELPAKFNKNWITAVAQTVDVWVRFVVDTAGAATSETLVETAASTITSQVIQPAATACFLLPAGVPMHFDLTPLHVPAGKAIKILHKSSAATGYLRIYKGSGAPKS